MAVQPIPSGYHSVTPYLMLEDVDAEMEFLQRAFGAQIKERTPGPDGATMHGEVRIGDSVVMMGRARDEWKPTPAAIYLYVEDTDATYATAIEAGATSIMEPADQFYGDRNGGVRDPAGITWWIATHVEDVTPDELAKRAAAAYGGGA